MQEAGKKFRYLVQFTSGQPTSDFTYTLYNQDGDTILSETVPITTGQVSQLIEIPGGSNTLTKPLYEQMTLEWEYTTLTDAITDSVTYTIHLPIGFPVDPDRVRYMLGVNSDELPNADIDLFAGFIAFRQMIGTDVDLSTYIDAGDYNNYQLTRAIEASTALQLLPSLQVRLPKKYDSGTSSYERWATMDWEGLAGELTAIIGVGAEIIDPEIELWPSIDIFVLSDRGPDQITGA